MPLQLDDVHTIRQDKEQNRPVVVRTNPYVRITHESEPPLLCQGGEIYSDGGQKITDVPKWFWIEAAKMTSKAREAVGLVLPKGHKGIKEKTVEELAEEAVQSLTEQEDTS